MNSKLETWLCVELPAIEYAEAWELQLELVAARKDGRLERDVVLLLEHPPVFTLGRRGGLENLTVSQAFLEKSGFPVFHAERGGNITFHGPGQLVGYPIINLQGSRLSVTDYVEKLEEVMIGTAADFGVQAKRNPMNRACGSATTSWEVSALLFAEACVFMGLPLTSVSLRNPLGG